ncbi:Periodic tryptophan protein 1 [Musa troglodytarum]|uniref:Periodic tryptophan protein 1 n=1 Tax=Musa troglodytarum TaxID=320322 RepID=A0A9E7L9W9_9LILI|nr:Periodic tryptophan protein 1 [Musa troglodytarum]
MKLLRDVSEVLKPNSRIVPRSLSPSRRSPARLPRFLVTPSAIPTSFCSIMISAVSWVPKGASKSSPVVAEPPSKEEIEDILRSGALGRSGDSEEEEQEDMDVDTSKEADEVAHALAAAEALSNNQGDKSSDFQDIADGLRELDMDNYDDEDDDIELFSTGLGDVYYPSNDMDPYLQNKDNDDDDDDEIEDMTIKPTDAVIVCAQNEDEVWIFEESDDGDSNMYVHHDIILPDFPLCTAWLDCNLKDSDKVPKVNLVSAGNFIAVGSMEPAIEIWDLDLIDEVQPFLVLGGLSKKKKKEKKTSVKYKKGSHRDSVLGLAWNKEVRNVLASASADKTVKIWDVVTGKCAVTVAHHRDKVQAVAWNQHSPEVLLSGSFDQSVVMVSLENGTVQGFDVRASSDSGSSSKPSFILHAHDKAVSAVSFNRAAPNFVATGSTDKMVKLWDLSNNQPSCVASQNLRAENWYKKQTKKKKKEKSYAIGSVFSVAFSDDNPFLLAIGGSKGRLEVWDTLSDPGVGGRFGKYSNRRTDPASTD